MAHEEKLEGARNAFAFYYAYVGAVAQEIGEEKALQLGADLDEKMGAAAGKAIRDKEGDRELGIKEATQLSMDYIRDRFGISSEMVEDSPQRIVTHCGECPLYGAGQMMGLDAKTFETSCRVGPIKFMDSLIKQLNPSLSYRLKKFRETADDFCQEEVTLS